MHHSHIDKFAYQDSPIHRIDSRVKFIAVIVFTALVISLPRTSFGILVCFAVGPFTMLVIGKVPLRFAFKHILIVSPFVLVLALSCPLYDREPVAVAFGPFAWEQTLGWLRCFVILGKFVVTMLALIALVSTTKFSDLLAGLQKLGVPELLIIQLGFLYRYIFILIDRAHHILRARAGRKLKNLGLTAELKTAGSMVGSLFVRTIASAEQINMAMQGRGFNGSWKSISTLRLGKSDLLFASAAALFMFTAYFLAGNFLT